jgi:microcin C transport system substrate-binding protein
VTVARGVTRRTTLSLLGGAALYAALPGWPARAAAQRHGLAVIGDLKYPPDFARFDYVNPNAPTGGRIITQGVTKAYNQDFNTFNTLNMFVLEGVGAQGMNLTFASLMAASADEAGSVYGYAASGVEVSEDGLTLRFFLRPEARFHDGTPITADDIVFSIETLKADGHPLISTDLFGVDEVAAENAHTARIRLGGETGLSLPVTIATLPIFSKAWWSGRSFRASLSEAPLGSGRYRVRDFRFGSYIEYERIADHWAEKLPIMAGRYNFERVRYNYYRDRVPAFEDFKKGEMTYREEFTSRVWAREYNFGALTEGKVKRDIIPDGRPAGAQGWFLNTRRSKFSDPRVREALGLAFDFEWTNKNLMFDSYSRTASFFENSPLKAEGLPSPAEQALLEPYRAKLPSAVFEEPYVPPKSDGSGRDRNLRRQATELLTAAGCTVSGGRLLAPDGSPLTIEFLDDDPTFEPHHNAYINGLKTLGIEAEYRVVDAAQYTERLKRFDYDVTVSRFAMALYPDEGILNFFHSDSAKRDGSNNLAGIADPVLDELLKQLVRTRDWDDFVTITRVVDRILRAGHYWVPHWHKGTHWIAFWDMFGRPETVPPYDPSIIDTWWFDAERAKSIGKAEG